MVADQPVFKPDDFASPSLEECDAIMKGGVTSGIVYPYAILEIARKYRLRSLGGTSAGAIAAAFAAAAEYARTVHGDPAGFVRLEERCLELPTRLPSLFQPDRAYRSVVQLGQQLNDRGPRAFLLGKLKATIVWLTLAALSAWLVALALHGGGTVQLLAAALGAALGMLGFIGYAIGWQLIRPIVRAVQNLPRNGFGLCGGRTVANAKNAGLTDWLHESIQYIAFGSRRRRRPLTFGDLLAANPPIDLRMVTTNLSLARPHTLPERIKNAGFAPLV